jgi:rhodanese-related sulfurtransferase
MTKSRFIAMVTTDQPPAPAYFGHDAALNKRLHPLLDEEMAAALEPLDEGSLAALEAEGAQVVDVRSADSFAAGHRRGSIFVGLDGRFASWAGTVLDPEAPVVLVAEAGREREAAMRLGRIGLRVSGFLDGGSHGLGRHLEQLDRLPPRELAARLAGPQAPLVLDVRAPGERAGAAIEGSWHIPLSELVPRLAELPRDATRDLVCVCGGGYRSVIAASLLRRAGVPRVLDLRGGMSAWQAAELATVGAGSTCRA